MTYNSLNIAKAILLKKGVFTYDAVAGTTGLSNKTVRNCSKQLDSFFSTYGLEILRKPGVGLYLSGSKEDKARSLKDVQTQLRHLKQITSKTRKNIIIYMLLNKIQALRISQLEHQLFVARPSIYKDLKSLVGFFAEYEIELIRDRQKGIYLDAGEKRKRHCLLDWTFAMLQEDLSDYHRFPNIIEFIQNFKELKTQELLSKFTRDLALDTKHQLSEHSLSRATIFLYVALVRAKDKNYVNLSMNVIDSIKDLNIYYFVRDHIHYLEQHFKTSLTPEEIVYISAQLSSYLNLSGAEDAINNPVINQLTDQAYTLFSKHLNITDRASLELGLKPYLQKIIDSSNFTYDLFNPYADYIMNTFPDLYQVAELFNPVLKKQAGIELPQAGIASICLILAHLREKSASQLTCAYLSGGSINEILYNKAFMENYLPLTRIDSFNSLADFQPENYDFILTDMDLPPELNKATSFALPAVLNPEVMEILVSEVHELRNQKRHQFIK